MIVLITDMIMSKVEIPKGRRIIFASSAPHLGMPSFQKSAVFLNIVQKAFDPPPLLFEHLSYFAGGIF